MADNGKIQFKEAPKRYGMSQRGMTDGYECEGCEGSMERSDTELVEVAKENPKFGGFLTRNNTWERI